MQSCMGALWYCSLCHEVGCEVLDRLGQEVHQTWEPGADTLAQLSCGLAALRKCIHCPAHLNCGRGVLPHVSMKAEPRAISMLCLCRL